MKSLRVLMLVDDEIMFDDDPAGTTTEHHIAQGLRRLGHKVAVMAFPPESRLSIRGIVRAKPDIVFNLVEHIGGNRRRSSQIPALLDILGIPYTGCTDLSMACALDKALSKYAVQGVGFRVPRFVVAPPGSRAPADAIGLPAIVKPRYGGGSEGITRKSVVHTETELRARVRSVHRRLRQDAICEEFIAGREFSAGIVGNGDRITVLPMRETVFGRAHEGGPNICTDRVKETQAYRDRWGVVHRRATLPETLGRRISDLCREAYRSLEMTGYARIDLRLSDREEPIFLEANPNPDLIPRILGAMAEWAGLTYEDLLAWILRLGLERAGRN
jgi:D-alanine-D-alanine ligase